MPGSERCQHYLFEEASLTSYRSCAQKIVENVLLPRTPVVSIGQVCADWFLMRKFCITGTKSGAILLSVELIRSAAGVEGVLLPDKSKGVARQIHNIFFQVQGKH